MTNSTEAKIEVLTVLEAKDHKLYFTFGLGDVQLSVTMPQKPDNIEIVTDLRFLTDNLQDLLLGVVDEALAQMGAA